jgi:predicted nucleic acid-binding protein
VIVVADTGPLISLAVIGLLDLPEKIFGQVVIPEAVWDELARQITVFNIPQAAQFQEKVVSLTQKGEPIYSIDDGEAEAIFLYEEIHAGLLLIDDKKARTVAESRNICCLGALAVLAEAKAQKLVPELRPLFLQLLAKKRYYTKTLLNTILGANNETPL